MAPHKPSGQVKDKSGAFVARTGRVLLAAEVEQIKFPALLEGQVSCDAPLEDVL